MKVLSMAEAQERFAAVCDEAVAGEVIRLQLANGALLQLTRVPVVPMETALSAQELVECYRDEEWASFENQSGKASD